MKNILLIGCGRQGEIYKEFLDKYNFNVEIFKVTNSGDNLNDYLKNNSFDKIILTVNPLDEQYIILKCLLQNYQGIIIVDKPVCKTIEQLVEINNTYQQSKNKIIIYQQEILSDIYNQFIEYIKNDLVNKIVIKRDVYLGKYFKENYDKQKFISENILALLEHLLNYFFFLDFKNISLVEINKDFSRNNNFINIVLKFNQLLIVLELNINIDKDEEDYQDFRIFKKDNSSEVIKDNFSKNQYLKAIFIDSNEFIINSKHLANYIQMQKLNQEILSQYEN